LILETEINVVIEMASLTSSITLIKKVRSEESWNPHFMMIRKGKESV